MNINEEKMSGSDADDDNFQEEPEGPTQKLEEVDWIALTTLESYEIRYQSMSAFAEGSDSSPLTRSIPM